MKRPINQTIPAGLLDGNCELFAHGEDVFATYSGTVYAFKDFPEELINVIKEDMYSHPEAIEALIDHEMVTDDEMLWQYIRCRFGGFDGKPDITYNNSTPTRSYQIEHTEYWECGFRGNCPMEGRLCASIKVKNGYLTPREIEILKLFGDGLLDKEVADKLNISIGTVPSFKKRIQEKTGMVRKTDFTRIAFELNLIQR
ncbi:LuxR C-terminal-related transcriptional regulator [Solitalea canadensis]|uniref:Response regulator containing a CheY-like receiver domain and an HTH DNA-binding domain n=1 Tax=Solitalea canadensis (strain ATCC 29591 / DSM 3403 / JCM 21819 / LMG 8368 / NBRC 15130 / NCIMB 12057 / USAM 9D) TaxID=929556 RepID=H8KPU5_SOLCM|nr:LuxR C-terminal-related transcriptional regulator [Solitalea canadensis]AFD05993.1 response regulator containing a CheY-like receiver domain and an HTH DNA-binding domain [Solitalea canadensis DSM 3403]